MLLTTACDIRKRIEKQIKEMQEKSEAKKMEVCISSSDWKGISAD